jgi:hypothetical protein
MEKYCNALRIAKIDPSGRLAKNSKAAVSFSMNDFLTNNSSKVETQINRNITRLSVSRNVAIGDSDDI